MLLAGWEVRIVKNGDLGLENAARGCRPHGAAFSSPRSQFFTIRTDLSRTMTCLSFYLGVNCFTSGFVYATLSLRRLQTIRKKSNERTNE